MDDFIISMGAAVITAAVVILATLLSRYRTVVREATKSSELAKNLWDAMNTRLTTQDIRIVDLMAKVDVYSVKKRSPLVSSGTPPVIGEDVIKQPSRAQNLNVQPSRETSQVDLGRSGVAMEETQSRILRALITGPKTANQIRDVIGVSREHTGRLMKSLFGRGLVVRNDQNKPYVYEVTEAGRRYLSEV